MALMYTVQCLGTEGMMWPTYFQYIHVKGEKDKTNGAIFKQLVILVKDYTRVLYNLLETFPYI